jgi:hypothetical protein
VLTISQIATALFQRVRLSHEAVIFSRHLSTPLLPAPAIPFSLTVITQPPPLHFIQVTDHPCAIVAGIKTFYDRHDIRC